MPWDESVKHHEALKVVPVNDGKECCTTQRNFFPIRFTWNPMKPTIYKWMEMVISNHFLSKDLVHHPIETTIYIWLALGFQACKAWYIYLHFYHKNLSIHHGTSARDLWNIPL